MFLFHMISESPKLNKNFDNPENSGIKYFKYRDPDERYFTILFKQSFYAAYHIYNVLQMTKFCLQHRVTNVKLIFR